MTNKKDQRIEIQKRIIKYSNYCIIFLLLVFIGVTFNAVVMVENGGRMPVLNSNLDTKTHFGFYDKEDINYYHFSDIFTITTSKIIIKYSIGDVLVIFPGILLIVFIFLNLKKQFYLKKLKKK